MVLFFTMLVASAACDPPTPPSQDPRIIWSAGVPNFLLPGADDQRVFFGDLDHGVHAVDRQTGELVWSIRTNPVGGPGFVAASNTVVAGPVVALADGYLFGFNRTSGAQRWQFVPAICFSGSVATDGTNVYTGCGDGRVFAVNGETGAKIWETRIADDTGGYARDPVLFRDTLYVGYLRRTTPRTGGFGAIDAKTGERLWYVEFPQLSPLHASAGRGSAAIVNDLVIAAADDGEIRAFERATGTLRWQAPNVTPADALGDIRPLASVGNVVMAGSGVGTVTGYDALTGAVLWTQTVLGSVGYHFAADSAQAYVIDGGGRLVALNAAGEIVWVFGGRAISSQGAMLGGAAVVDGVVYVGGAKAAYALRAYD